MESKVLSILIALFVFISGINLGNTRRAAGINIDENDSAYPLFEAIGKENDSTAQKLIADGGISNLKLSEALHLAAYAGNEPIASQLIKSGASVNFRDIAEKSALHKAAARGHEPVVVLLVNNGANVNAENIAHETVLISAAEKGNEKIVEFLIEHGAMVNAKDMEENTALHVAANAGKEKAVEVLLKHGADTKALNDEGKTPLDLAKNWHTAKYERIADMLSAHE